MGLLAETVDNLIDARPLRKVLIHTHSYKRAEMLQARSKYGRHMIMNSSGAWYHGAQGLNAQQAADKFRKAVPMPDHPAMLVGPSFTTGWDFPNCVAPETRVLTRDLHWVAAGDLKEGDRLIAFDEHAPKERRSRQWCDSFVTKSTGLIKKECYKLILADGTEFICSTDHPWLSGNNSNVSKWTKSKFLRASGKCHSSLSRICDPWPSTNDTEFSYLLGYIAAAYDGEGHLSSRANSYRSRAEMPTTLLGFTQRNNIMLAEMAVALARLGVAFKAYEKRHDNPKHQDTFNLSVIKRKDILKVLGWARPKRLLELFYPEMLGSIRTEDVKIVAKESIGMHEVAAFSTSTSTFVAEGFASHNTQCEVNIILKIPWPDLSSPIMEARAEDEQYAPYITMQDLVQACGRAQRTEKDRSETFILDGGIENFQYFAKQHAPQWWSCRRIEGIPKEPVKL